MVEVRGVTKRFGAFTAVDDVSLTVRTGEFLTLLGPSGCGKTTLLRLLAGFETPEAGAILLDGRDVTHEPPYRRNVNQVFQSYALFPHLNVRDNIGFGLRMQRVPRAEAETRIREAVAAVSLAGMAERSPAQLSGGQRQRVALARALVCRPKVLLLDEPLSALDAKLRHAMQLELKHLQRRLGLTFIFVTHDQDEALAISDRIAILHRGRIEQIDAPAEIYCRPATAFAADFIGQANLFEAEILAREGPTARVRLPGGLELTVPANALPPTTHTVTVSIRPEKIFVSKTSPGGANVCAAHIEEKIFQGPTDRLWLVTESGTRLHTLAVNESAHREALQPGDRVHCAIHADDIIILPGR
jgi:spermidine/putrescine transport system ATP-binding protein